MQLTRHHAHQFTKQQARGSLNSARCSGPVAVQLTATGRQGQKVHQLAWWLRQHARSVQRLDLQLNDSIGDSPDDVIDMWPEEEVQAVTSALQHAASTGPLVLQHFSLGGHSVPCDLLAALPASCLTSLKCEMRIPNLRKPDEPGRYITAVNNISHLQQLQQLEVSIRGDRSFAELTYQDALMDLTRLEHLTSLALPDTWFFWKDEQVPLPHNLVQLEVQFVLRKQDVESFGKWLQERANLLTHLSLDCWWKPKDLSPAAYCDAWSTALRHAAAASGGKLPLQHLSAHIELSSQLYRQLGEHCQLSTLDCRSGPALSDSAIRNAEVLSAICAMTSLRELTFLSGGWECSTIGDLSVSVLQQLSILTNLAKLSISGVTPQQVQYLPAGLSELTVMLDERIEQRAGFDMGHLASLTKLDMLEITYDDVLPPNLISIHTCGCGYDRVGSANFQPLLRLHRLQEMELSGVGSVTSAQLQDLSSLCSLTSLRLEHIMMEKSDRALTAEDMAAWASLPVTSLTVEYWELPFEGAMPGVVVEGLLLLRGLTELKLEGCIFEHDAPVLRDALLSLTELRKLDICLGIAATDGSMSSICCEGTTQSMLAAAETLPHLEECQLLI